AMMMMSMDMTGPPASPVSIKLHDCVARGDASLLRATQPVDLEWSNGLAVLSEPLFVGDSVMTARTDRWNLKIEHLTAHLRGGLCKLSAGMQMVETSISCRNSILISQTDLPLIRQQGDDVVTNLKNKLAWLGQQNLYEGVQKFWSVTDLMARQPTEEIAEAAW